MVSSVNLNAFPPKACPKFSSSGMLSKSFWFFELKEYFTFIKSLSFSNASNPSYKTKIRNNLCNPINGLALVACTIFIIQPCTRNLSSVRFSNCMHFPFIGTRVPPYAVSLFVVFLSGDFSLISSTSFRLSGITLHCAAVSILKRMFFIPLTLRFVNNSFPQHVFFISPIKSSSGLLSLASSF